MDDARLSLDLLIGLSVFLFTFIYVANFLPGLFADVRHEISLASQAYRIAALLAEDPGYPLDWNTEVNVNNCNSTLFRPGLAEFGSKTEYGELNSSKILNFTDLLADPVCKEVIRTHLGLNLTNVSWEKYKFNVSLRALNGSLVVAGGDEIPESGQIVKFERIVYLSNSALKCDDIAGRNVCKLEVVVWI